MATIEIDGRSFQGRRITIQNGKVIVDGKMQDGTLHGVVEVKVTEGVLEALECDASVTCGEIRGNVNAGGSVSCKSVGGSIRCGGSVKVDGNAGGAINCGGSVTVGSR